MTTCTVTIKIYNIMLIIFINSDYVYMCITWVSAEKDLVEPVGSLQLISYISDCGFFICSTIILIANK